MEHWKEGGASLSPEHSAPSIGHGSSSHEGSNADPHPTHGPGPSCSAACRQGNTWALGILNLKKTFFT